MYVKIKSKLKYINIHHLTSLVSRFSQVLFLLSGNLLSLVSSVRFLETNSFRQESGGENLQEPKSRYLDSRNLRDSGFGDNRYEIVNDFQQSAYVDSSEIRGSEKTVSGDPTPQFSPMQFPTPLKYDESNAIRYPYSQSANSQNQDEGQSAPKDGKGVYQSTLFRDSDSIERSFNIGNIDIGESTESSLERSGEFLRGRDIEIYHNPGENPYSGESIDIEMFDGVPSDGLYAAEESGENHPGSTHILLKCD